MTLIFYDEAARILGYSEDAVRHAAIRGELTRAGTLGNRQRLIKEQVILFTGMNPRTGRKKRISYNALSPEEQALWNRYANAVNTEPGTEIAPVLDESTVRRIVEENYSQQFVSLMDSLAALIESGVPQGTFFQEHPILGTIVFSLIIAASIASAIVLYQGLSRQEKQEVLAYLNVVDATLQLQERMPEPPISIDEIRKRRERIAAFKSQAVA